MPDNQFQLKTPVLMLIFNRPDLTKQIFEAIRQARPPKLLIVADGPRSDRANEAMLCEQTRSIVIDHIDWPCEIQTNFATQNMGCRDRVASGITWGFELEEELIILEDDCLPHPDFFKFCQEMLAYYKDNPKVMHISGSNYSPNCLSEKDSYIYSKYSFIWGWATWKSAWNNYSTSLKNWPSFRDDDRFKNIFDSNRMARTYWKNIFNRYYSNKIDTWDYQWILTCLMQQGLSIVPSTNLVINIGLGDINATHTRRFNKKQQVATKSMQWPIKHPVCIQTNPCLEKKFERNAFGLNWSYRITSLIR